MAVLPLPSANALSLRHRKEGWREANKGLVAFKGSPVYDAGSIGTDGTMYASVISYWGIDYPQILYRTDDNGKTCENLNSNLPLKGEVYVTDIIMNPRNSAHVYLLTADWKDGTTGTLASRDRGQTWKRMSRGFNAISFDPLNPSVLYFSGAAETFKSIGVCAAMYNKSETPFNNKKEF